MRDLEVGRVARALRLRLGWRQVDLADRAGVDQKTVSRLESGAIERFTLAAMRRVCAPLGLDVADVQGLLRPLDIKVRLARDVAAERGWRARSVVACLVVADRSTARRRVAIHEPLFARFDLRGRAARRWLGDPSSGAAGGLLLFQKLSGRPGGSGRRAGRQRIRRSKRSLSAEASAHAVHAPQHPA